MTEAAKTVTNSGGSDDDAVVAAMAVAGAARSTAPEGLVDHAVMLFLTHQRAARNISIPNLMSRMAWSPPAGARTDHSVPDLSGTTGSVDEDKLNWFREDPLANEHHEHWHLVYVRADGVNFKVRPRHGELFFYMHQQMLARYDAERLAVGLPRVVPFADYSADVGEGYDAGGLVIGSFEFAKRPSSVPWQAVTLGRDPQGNPIVYRAGDHELRRDRLAAAVEALALVAPDVEPVPLAGAEGSDILGHTEESGALAVGGGGAFSHFGNHHGFGHVLTASLSNPDRPEQGVMYHPAAAIRDPFFWRWHRHVDDLNFRYQEKLEPHHFQDAPLVEFGGGDDSGIIVIPSASLKAARDESGASPEEIAKLLFGGAAFGTDSAIGERNIEANGQPLVVPFTDTLETEMRRGIFQLDTDAAADEEPRFSYPYLWHPSYHFAIRLRSAAAHNQTVTVRLFLCPAFAVGSDADGSLDDRRLWIEIDKFEATLPAGEESVLTRADTDSTIVRRPVTSVTANPDFVRDLNYGAQGDDHPDAAACECGWPYHLLYPRGTPEGMRFALLAVVTTGDRLAKQGRCGSMSFCAVNDEYPDLKPMGYPFDRPLSRPLKELVDSQPSMAMRFITIRTR